MLRHADHVAAPGRLGCSGLSAEELVPLRFGG